MTDAQLIDCFKGGDLAAFNRLVARWEKPIYNFVLRYMGNREEAKDICQNVFIRVYRSISNLRDVERFSAWIYQIAVNVCKDELRKRKRRSAYSLSLVEPSQQTLIKEPVMEKNLHNDPEMAAQHTNIKSLLGKALQAIPEEQRVVVIMKEYQGLKFTEIAAVLNISVNTAKSRMYYGLSALKRIFDEWNIDREKISYEV